MRVECLRTLPLLDHDEAIRTNWRLKSFESLGIGCRTVGDAAGLRANGGNICVKGGQQRVTLPWFCGNKSQNVNHGRSLSQAQPFLRPYQIVTGVAPEALMRTGPGFAAARGGMSWNS